MLRNPALIPQYYNNRHGVLLPIVDNYSVYLSKSVHMNHNIIVRIMDITNPRNYWDHVAFYDTEHTGEFALSDIVVTIINQPLNFVLTFPNGYIIVINSKGASKMYSDDVKMHTTILYISDDSFRLNSEEPWKKYSALTGLRQHKNGLLPYISLPNGHIGSIYVNFIDIACVNISLIDFTTDTAYKSGGRYSMPEDIKSIINSIKEKMNDGTIGDDIRVCEYGYSINQVPLYELDTITYTCREHIHKLFIEKCIVYTENVLLK